MFADKIKRYISIHPVFDSKEIQTGLKISRNERAVFNTELARMEQNGEIVRIARGLYATIYQTCFGATRPQDAVIAEKIYIANDNGYITGPSFLEQLGASTWLPRETHITSNKYRAKIQLKNFVIKRPVIPITAKNKPYLQVLDCIEALHDYATDSKDTTGLLLNHIKQKDLDATVLLLMCHKYYKKATEQRLYEILEAQYAFT